MAILLSSYDEAILELFKKVFVNGNVAFEPAETAFRYVTAQTDNSLRFPYISFYPISDIPIDKSASTFPNYKTGAYPRKISDEISHRTQSLKLIRSYYIDIWGIERTTTEQLLQETLFWLFENQTVKVKYGEDILNMSFDIGNSITDNTDLTKYATEGMIYRFTIPISVDLYIFRTEKFFNVLEPIISIIPKGGNNE